MCYWQCDRWADDNKTLTGFLELGRLREELRGLVGVHKVGDPVEDVAIVDRDLLALDLLPALDPDRALRHLFLLCKGGDRGREKGILLIKDEERET